MNDLIEISNLLLINYWWIILPVCLVLGTVMFLLTDNLFNVFNNKVVNQTLVDSGMKWDKYGNPIFDDEQNLENN